MCGISGILYFDKDKKVNKELLLKMTNSIIHRGPDDEGFYINSNIGLGFRRLSIIDLSAGHQPLSNENEKIWIVFNGEIYNFKVLRDDLKKQGHEFKTQSDTETIVHLYEQYGPDCVKHLRGMFSFAIWDENIQQLFIARDRFGIKPLYYYLDNEKFIFGSEIKQIIQCENIDKSIDLRALDSFFTYGYITDQLSIYNKIKKVPQSHYGIISPESQSLKLSRYWDIIMNPDYSKSEEYWAEEIEKTLSESVNIHMLSDVPLGAFLSGGIDSSSVVSLMSKYSNQPIKTFSIGFKEKEFNELDYALEISDKYKTQHHVMIVEPESIDILPKIVKAFDEPFADASALPTYYVSKFARENVTVALSGDGGDELFTGYDTYPKFNKLNRINTNWPGFNRLFWGTINKCIPDYIFGKGLTYYLSLNKKHLAAYSSKWRISERKNLFTNDVNQKLNGYAIEDFKANLLNISKTKEYISKMQELDMRTYMVDDVLTKVDRMSMINSLEVRVPILDHIFAELSFKIPIEIKFKNRQQKYILKKAMQKNLTSNILQHKKQGFAVPLKIWFRDDLNAYMADKLISNNAKVYDFVNSKIVKDTINNHHKNQRDFSSKIWSLIILEEWLNTTK
jgi:asparagine synthase (glutamine-hydrolysing)